MHLIDFGNTYKPINFAPTELEEALKEGDDYASTEFDISVLSSVAVNAKQNPFHRDSKQIMENYINLLDRGYRPELADEWYDPLALKHLGKRGIKKFIITDSQIEFLILVQKGTRVIEMLDLKSFQNTIPFKVKDLKPF
jgi:hypothetical protein